MTLGSAGWTARATNWARRKLETRFLPPPHSPTCATGGRVGTGRSLPGSFDPSGLTGPGNTRHWGGLPSRGVYVELRAGLCRLLQIEQGQRKREAGAGCCANVAEISPKAASEARNRKRKTHRDSARALLVAFLECKDNLDEERLMNVRLLALLFS
jgi:hypothetical protein